MEGRGYLRQIWLSLVLVLAFAACSGSALPSATTFTPTPAQTTVPGETAGPTITVEATVSESTAEPTATAIPLPTTLPPPEPTLALSATPTPASTPIATPNPTPTPMPTPVTEVDKGPNLQQPSLDEIRLVGAATFYAADFEAGYPIGLNDFSRRWHINQDADGNAIFCNAQSEEWSSFQLGRNDWENYAVSLRMKFLSANQDQGAEIYFRINESAEGYRASIWNNDHAQINFYPPSANLGGSSVTIIPDRWYQLRVQGVDNNLKYLLDDQLLVDIFDDKKLSGRAGVGASPNTQVCVDDIRVWGLDKDGNPIEDASGLAVDLRSIYEGDNVFGFINGSDPSMPVWNTSSQGYAPQANDAREQAVLDESFSVGANKEVTFENQIVWVRPNQRQDIEVHGRLVIRDSLLLWDQTEHQQTRLRIKNGGELDIKNSYVFRHNQYWSNWEYEDGSTVLFDNFVGDPWTSIHGSVDYTATNYSTVKLTFLRETHDSNFEVSDAHHVWLELFPPAGEYEITFPEKRQWADWDLDLWPNTIVEVKDSYLYERDISISNDTHVSVIDTPSGFSLGWAIGKDMPGQIDCELSDLGDPHDDTGVFYEDMTWDLPCNNSSLTVKNSVLQRAWPVIWGHVNLKINNSNLVDPRVFGGPAVMEIYDSTIDHIAAYQEGRVYIENSQIRYDVEVKDPNSAIYGHKVSKRDEAQEIEILEVDGGSYVDLATPNPPW